MIEYSVPGLKLSYPKNLTRKGNFPYLTINNSKSGSTLSIILLNKQTTYENEFKIKLDPANIWDMRDIRKQNPENFKDADVNRLLDAHETAKPGETTMGETHELIRAGNYDKFPGAVERLLRTNKQNLQFFYRWEILIPINNRLIEIRAQINALLQGMDEAGNFIWMPPTDPLKFNPYEIENIWQPIIDCLEFNSDIIDALPDQFEGMANSKKIDYSTDLMKMSYPEGCKYEESDIINTVINIVSGSSLDITIFPGNIGSGGSNFYNMEYEEKVNPRSLEKRWKDPTAKCEIIRSGDYNKFPAGKEILLRSISGNGTFNYWWILLILIENCAIRIQAESNDLAEMDYVWQPLVESMELNHESIAKFSYKAPKRPQCSWEKSTEGQSEHFNFEFSTLEHLVGLYATKGKLFTKSELEDDALTMNLIEEKWDKKNKRLLLSIITDTLALPVDIYLNTDPPAENDPAWDQIIEGFIDFSAGKMLAEDSYDDSVPSLEIVLPQKGIYKFRIYYGGLDCEFSEVEEHWQIYLWPTDETIESNEIKVIKAFENS